MPELPEVEITARLLDRQIAGDSVQLALAPGINVLKSFDPPLSALAGRKLSKVRRIGKHILIDFEGDLTLLLHLMSAGRLQLYEKHAGPRDRTSRLLLRLDGGGTRELRLREFGSKQAAWAKLLPTAKLEQEPALVTLGPEAWPQAPQLDELLAGARPLNALLRDQRTIAGIGRSWADEILWRAKLSPFKRGGDLHADERQTLRREIEATLDEAIAHYEEVLKLPIPDKLPMPLKIHRHEGEPCPRCGTTLGAVHFDEHVIAYCPTCQTGGKPLKDRRLSRLLK